VRAGATAARRARDDPGAERGTPADDAPVGGGTLYVVSTPIGNLGDMTTRATEVLSSVALVLAEDTRHTRPLLAHFGIRTPMASYHRHNEARETPALVQRLLQGDSLALVSDAGTPLLSDPGARLVSAAIAAGISVVPVPGASALLGALVMSGLPVDEFTFVGFLPRRGHDRTRALAEVVNSSRTVVLYEAGPRIGATLAGLAAAGARARRAVIAREITKRFEEAMRGTVEELCARVGGEPPRGELVLVIEGALREEPDAAGATMRAAALGAAGHSVRDVTERLVAEFGLARNAAYRIARAAADGASAAAPAGD